MTTLESLAVRLQMLEDERAILQTLHQYGHAMDYGPDVGVKTAAGASTSESRRSTICEALRHRPRRERASLCARVAGMLIARIPGNTGRMEP